MIERAYDILFTVMLIFFAVCTMFALVRAVRGPRIADRIMAVNMTGTLAIMMLAILAVKLKESYLLDVSLIYGLISFVAVCVLCSIYITVHLKKQASREDKTDE